MTTIIDCLNNQFRLYTFIDSINSNLVQFIENNNLNTNYYCIKCELNDVMYIVTSNTIKNNEDGYRLIIINKNNNCNNGITQFGASLRIFYEDTEIITSELMQIIDINNKLNEYDVKIISKTYNKISESYNRYCELDFDELYDKNILVDYMIRQIL
jgi:hypothetical protein